MRFLCCASGFVSNPLADPGLIGVSSGAALGAIFMIVLGGAVNMPASLAPHSISIAAIFGATAVTGLLFAIAQEAAACPSSPCFWWGLLLTPAGVGIGFPVHKRRQPATNADVLDDGKSRSSGLDVAGAGTVLMLTGFCLLIQTHRQLDLLQLGEPEAEFMGVDVAYLKADRIRFCAGRGCCCFVGGMIGFIGLVVPHLVRFLFGVTHRALMYGSAVVGASLLMLADTIARIAIPPAEIPVSLITSAIGAPFFFG